jgi:hypothetical protein
MDGNGGWCGGEEYRRDILRDPGAVDVVIFWATKMVGPTYGLGPFVNGEGALLETALSPVLCAS